MILHFCLPPGLFVVLSPGPLRVFLVVLCSLSRIFDMIFSHVHTVYRISTLIPALSFRYDLAGRLQGINWFVGTEGAGWTRSLASDYRSVGRIISITHTYHYLHPPPPLSPPLFLFKNYLLLWNPFQHLLQSHQ